MVRVHERGSVTREGEAREDGGVQKGGRLGGRGRQGGGGAVRATRSWQGARSSDGSGGGLWRRRRCDNSKGSNARGKKTIYLARWRVASRVSL